MPKDLTAVLAQLISATTSTQIRALLSEIGDHPDSQLNDTFGGSFKWVAVGNNPSNLSTIGLGTKPGRSLTERLTNAVDALLEDRVPQGVILPDSPRAAAQQWFGRPISSSETGLYKWDYSSGGIDKRIGVILLQGDDPNAPTIDVIDDGIGINAARFGSTILSLQGGNKITKRYLIGAFGQGGSATLAFCDYAAIVSRHRDNPSEVAFTIIRVLNLNETYKEECFAYLALASGDAVPFCTYNGPLPLYTSDVRLPEFNRGTLVRHIGYKLEGLTGNLGPAPGNLYHYLHAMMFDPLLPFRIYDLRDKGRAELVTGSRNRLMKLTAKSTTPGEESGSEMRHYREMEYFVSLGEQEATIGIEYWVILNYKKSKKDQLILRAQSNELYIQTGHPILGTLNGQNQGERTAQLLRDTGLVMVSRHIIIHVDASMATSRTRRHLFSTNREGFKDGPVLSGLLQVLRKMLEEDQTLFALERELTEKVAQREAQTTSDEVKRQVTRLLLEAGYQVADAGPSYSKGEQESQPVRVERKGKPLKPDPLPTLPFPDVTRLVIVAPTDSCQIRLNDIEVVLAETDADAEFDRRGLLALRTEPPLLEIASKTPLRGGRVRWRLRTTGDAQVGQVGEIIATITRPDGTQLRDSKTFVIQAPAEEKSKKAKGQVPPFEIIPINPDDNPDKWGVAWPDLGEEVPFEKQQSVAYKPVKLSTGITVYYSTIFRPFSEQTERLKLQSTVLHDLFRTNYEVWIGYHAILQISSAINESDEKTDRLLESERANVAQMEVKQSLKMAELLRDTLKDNLAREE